MEQLSIEIRIKEYEIRKLTKEIDTRDEQRSLLRNEVSSKMTELWKLKKEIDPTLSECCACHHRQGIGACSHYKRKICYDCVDEEEDSNGGMTYRCDRCMQRLFRI